MKARIVIIDDDENILELFSAILQEDGHEVHLRELIFNDLAEVERLAPDLIILDLFVGNQREGWEFLQRLKTHKPTATIPLILCTAANLAPEEKYFTQQNRIPIIPKPFELNDLNHLVRHLVGSETSSV